MSKGTPRFALRISPQLMERITSQIISRNWWSSGEAWSVSDFVRISCEEKLAKMARSRKRRPGRRRGPRPDEQSPAISGAKPL